jgi:hypothetical protein
MLNDQQICHCRNICHIGRNTGQTGHSNGQTDLSSSTVLSGTQLGRRKIWGSVVLPGIFWETACEENRREENRRGGTLCGGTHRAVRHPENHPVRRAAPAAVPHHLMYSFHLASKKTPFIEKQTYLFADVYYEFL